MHPASASAASRAGFPASVIAVLPARYESSRFPGKPLADLAGRPMIEHVYRRTAAARSVGRVIVATDDARIAAAVEAFGGEVRLTRRDHQSGTDRVAEVVETLACELVVNVQGDEPLVEPAMIEEALAPLLLDPSLQMGTLRRRLDDAAQAASPHVTKVVVDAQEFALYFSRAPIPYLRGAGADVPRYKHIGLYVYRRECLLALARTPRSPLERAEALEQLRALEHGVRIRTVETLHDSIGVDTPDDLERARQLLAAAPRL